MKWFLKTAYQEARNAQFRGVLMLFSMVFGLSVLVSFSAIKQGFQSNFYTIATLLSGGDLRIEITGKPTERFTRLLPKLGDSRDAYWNLTVVDDSGNEVGNLRVWVVEHDTQSLQNIEFLRDSGIPEVVPVSVYGTRDQLQRMSHELGESFRLEGGVFCKIEQVFETEEELLPVWAKRLEAKDESRLVINTSFASLLTAQTHLPWKQVWVYHFESHDVHERIAMAKYILGYLNEENQGIRMIHELPSETGFYFGFQLISNTLFLAAFSALMLGTLAYTVTFVDFSRGKKGNVALLRCLGGSRMSSWSVYGVQVITYGVLSILIAAVLSVGIQIALPKMIVAMTGIQLHIEIYWRALFISLAFGGCFMLLPGIISILPLLGCEPVEVLRSSKVPAKQSEYRWIQSILITITVLLAIGFCLQMVEDSGFAMMFLVSMIVVFFTLLYGVLILRKAVRKIVSNWHYYPLSQAAANLFRAQNNYIFTLTSIAFGLFLITFLYVFFEGFGSQGMDAIAGYAKVEDNRVSEYLVWLQKVFFINQWMGVTLLVIGVLAVFVLLTSQRRTRLYEAVILGTLGADDRMIRQIMLFESIFSGCIVSLLGPTGGLLLGTIIFGIFFNIPIIFPWLLFIIILPTTIGVMALMGFANLKGILGHAPLEVLRKRRHFSNW